MNYGSNEQLDLVKAVFSEEFNDFGSHLHRSIVTTPSDDVCWRYINVMRESIGSHYLNHKGLNWEADKLKEMKEEGLIYVSYEIEEKIAGFISFVLTEDEGELVVYLYEIQVLPDFHGVGIGRFFINSFHSLVSQYNKVGIQSLKIGAGEVVGSKLTVFSDNKVVDWYFKLGYVYSDESPLPRKLRSGRSILPDFYILIRRTK